jgi:hypothetical protein
MYAPDNASAGFRFQTKQTVDPMPGALAIRKQFPHYQSVRSVLERIRSPDRPKLHKSKTPPRLAKRASLRSPRRTRRGKCAQTMLCAYGFCIDVRTSAWIIRRQAKSHAPIRMRDCSSSKSLRMAICIRSILFWTNPQTRQWCQNSANKMIIGSGTPSSHSKAPLPKPIVASHFSHMNLTRTPFVSSSAQITSRARVHGP